MTQFPVIISLHTIAHFMTAPLLCHVLNLSWNQFIRSLISVIWLWIWMDNIKSEGALTHWGRATHICVSKLIIIGSDNGLSPEWRQAIIWTIAGILFIGTLGTNFSQILSEIHTFSLKKMHLKMSCGKCRPSCLGLNVLMTKHEAVIAILFSPVAADILY